MTFDLIPIGEVRSPVSDRRLMPPEGVPAAIEVYPEFADGLLLIEENTHLWVIGWLEEADRTRLQIVRAAYEPARRRRGVFGLRSAARPNSLSLSATRLVAVEGTTLRVDSLDLVDGTPVVDLKRYSPSWDCIFSARSSRDRYLLDRADPARQSELEHEAANFHGERCPWVVAAARLVQFLSLGWNVMPKDDGLRVTVGADPEVAHLADPLQALTAATLGSGRLGVAPGRAVTFALGERRLTAEPLAIAGMDEDTLRRVDLHQLFQLTER